MSGSGMERQAGFSMLEEDVMTRSIPNVGVEATTVYRGDDDLRVVVFAFAAGAELTPHRAPRQALIEVRSGELEVWLGEDVVAAAAGSWIRMDCGLIHAVAARVPSIMRLTLLPASPGAEVRSHGGADPAEAPGGAPGSRLPGGHGS
jgi:quercetin dioxygenase-like cupin family protein